MAADGIAATIDGRLEDALAISERAKTIGEETGLPVYSNVMSYLGSNRARSYLGEYDPDEAARGMEAVYPGYPHMFANLLADMGRTDEVNNILDSCVVQRTDLDSPDYEFATIVDLNLLQAAIKVGHCPAIEKLLRWASGKTLFTPYFGLFVPTRYQGGAAALLGKYDEARKYYMEAIRVCTEMPFRPELALSRLQLAELLLQHYPDEKKEALEHLDFAIKEFREMKMQPSLERALRHKEILKA
jgi:tetratricopeptide (TPR) repeat protein